MFICRQRCFFSKTGNLFDPGMKVENVPPGLEECFDDLSVVPEEPWAEETDEIVADDAPVDFEDIDAVKAKLEELNVAFHPNTGLAKLVDKLKTELTVPSH